MKLTCSKAAASMILFALTPPAVEPPGGHVGLKALHRGAGRLLKVFDGVEPAKEFVADDGRVGRAWTFFHLESEDGGVAWDEETVEVELEQSWFDAIMHVWAKTPKLQFLGAARKRAVCISVQDALDAAKAELDKDEKGK